MKKRINFKWLFLFVFMFMIVSANVDAQRPRRGRYRTHVTHRPKKKSKVRKRHYRRNRPITYDSAYRAARRHGMSRIDAEYFAREAVLLDRDNY